MIPSNSSVRNKITPHNFPLVVIQNYQREEKYISGEENFPIEKIYNVKYLLFSISYATIVFQNYELARGVLAIVYFIAK